MERQGRNQRCHQIVGAMIAVGIGVLLSLFLENGSAVVEAVNPDKLVSEHISGDWGYGLDDDGNAVIIDYYGDKDEIVLGDQIDGHTIVGLGRSHSGYVFRNYQKLKKIILPDTIVSLDHAFFGCDQLSEVILPNYLKAIGDYTFFECGSLVTIDLPSTVEIIGDSAFSRCYSLGTISLPQSLKSIGREAFADSFLQNILLPKGLEKIDSTAFYGCYHNDEIIIIQMEEGNSNFHVEKGILYDCDKKEVIMALDRSMLSAELDLGVQRINSCAFRECRLLKSVTLPDTLEYIGDEAFSRLRNLQSFAIPPGVTEIGEGILSDSSITKLEIKASIKDLKNICHGCRSLEQVFLPEGVETVSGFSGCSSLIHISLPDSVKTIEECAFWDSGLKSITIPAGTTCIEETALSAPGLTEIAVEEGNSLFYTRPDGLYNKEHVLLVTSIQNGEVCISEDCCRIGALAFPERDQIQRVWIPDSVKEIGQDAFTGCKSLASVKIGKQLEKIELGAFAEVKSNIQEAVWEDGVCYLNSYAISYDQPKSFSGVLSLREGCTLIADCCFEKIDSLEYLLLPDSLQYIGDRAFSDCYALKEIIGGKALAAIGEYAFGGSRKLERLFLQGEKIKIGSGAFNCTSVSELMVDAQEVELSEDCFSAFQECRTIVLPNLNIPVRQVFSMAFHANMAKLLLTNMSAESLNEQEGLFDNCSGMRLYLPFSDNELRNHLSKQGVYVFNRDQWYLSRFMVYGAMKQLSILSKGDRVISPIVKENDYAVTPSGPFLSDIQWDLNGDGIPDELPDIVTKDIKAEALYQIKELPHSHNWQIKEIQQEQTCTQSGKVLYYCSGCGKEKEESLVALGHSYSENWTIDQEASCTEMGSKSHHCIREGCVERENITPISMTTHIWDEGIITVLPQIGVAGEKTFTCSVCKLQKKEEVAALPTESVIPLETPMPTKSAVPLETPMPIESAVLPGLPAPNNNRDISFSTSAATTSVRKAVLSAIPGLKVSTDHYTKVKLTWKAVPGASYQIYRSASRDSGYKRIKKNVNKTYYQDTSVQSGKFYYYRVRAIKTVGGKQIIQAESQTKQIKIRTLTRPTIQIQKKRTADIRYLVIKVKKYKGKQIEIYYKDSKRSSYRKVKLYEDRIQKMKKTFRIQYLSTKRNLYLKVRTYQKKKGKKVYSSYTREKKIKV